MLWTIIIILLAIWALVFLGGIGAAAVGNLIHILAFVAIVLIIIKLVRRAEDNYGDGLGL